MPEATARAGTRLTSAQQIAPHNYARLLEASYLALKKESRQNIVIGGSTFTGGTVSTEQWIQNLRLPDGKPPSMDMYAHNPFSYQPPSFSGPPSPFGEVQFRDLPRLAGWVDRYLHRGLPLFLSAWSISTSPDDTFPFWVNAPVATKWIQQALRIARRWHRIYAIGWQGLYDSPPAFMSGLIEADGTHKSLYAAYQQG